MRIRFISLLATLPLAACASSSGGDEGPTPFDDEHGPSEDNINDGLPDNDSLPDDTKADAVFPAQFEVGDQSPVKSQGSRGVCSIFSSTAQVENLYIMAGMPVDEADFSEQYLQWATKNLPSFPPFPNTSGSSSDINARTVVDFGTVKESEWRYESTQWGTFNDPECTEGENLPTKCYTNGEPPANVELAQKFKLPSSRSINTSSMKQHLTTKKSGVNVGFTFFYQSWNHRRSTLPINNEYWRQGIVTYPNAKDKEVSLEKRAGHAIHIVGWDDNKEVCMRDGEGNDVPDGAGGCKKEKGFWIFKNSWGTAGFGIDHPTGAGYGYLSYQYVREFGRAVIAEIPQLNIRETCDDVTERDEDGDGQANCSDADCQMHPACAGGGTSHTFTAAPNAAIPDNSPTGVSSTIEVPDGGNITDVKLTLDVSHSFRGDLKVTLTKGTQSIVVFNGDGGSADDLKQTFTVTGISGELRGPWTLKVEDTANIDTGTLNMWSIEVSTN